MAVAAMRSAGRAVEGWSCAAREVAEVAIAARARATRRAPMAVVAVRSILFMENGEGVRMQVRDEIDDDELGSKG